MILANVDWLSISITLLLIVFVIVCILMSLLILMQRPKQEGLGAAFGSGMTDQVFGAQTTNVLQKGTVYLGSLFFILTITLAILYARKNERNYSMKKDEPAAIEETVETPVEDAPVGSLEDELETTPIGGGDTPAVDDGAEATEDQPEAGESTETEAPGADASEESTTEAASEEEASAEAAPEDASSSDESEPAADGSESEAPAEENKEQP
ncbi:MAG: preprotein translocase subunit SecG [Verrucomicrobiota bacterium]